MDSPPSSRKVTEQRLLNLLQVAVLLMDELMEQAKLLPSVEWYDEYSEFQLRIRALHRDIMEDVASSKNPHRVLTEVPESLKDPPPPETEHSG